MALRKAQINRYVRGKVVQSVEQNYDGGQLHGVQVNFTDGTHMHLLNTIRPDVEASFTRGPGDDDLIVCSVPRKLFRQ